MRKNKMNAKALLKSKRGTTLIETLCAFLIVALSVGLLSTAIGAANQINTDAKKQWTGFLDEVSDLEQKANAGTTGVLTITDSKTGMTIMAVPIKNFTGDVGSGLRYYVPD